jgi:vitamin B12/bleomycin/antimicrobial peptide transport system ATP-binding/permease protein
VHVRGQSSVADIWSLARPYWVSEEKWAARGLLALVVGLSLSSIYIAVLVNHWNEAFYNALQAFDATEFFRHLLIFVGLTAANVVCAVYQVYLSQMLQIRWRRWLTESFLEAWLKDQAYYRGVVLGAVSENPDQLEPDRQCPARRSGRARQ